MDHGRVIPAHDFAWRPEFGCPAATNLRYCGANAAARELTRSLLPRLALQRVGRILVMRRYAKKRGLVVVVVEIGRNYSQQFSLVPIANHYLPVLSHVTAQPRRRR